MIQALALSRSRIHPEYGISPRFGSSRPDSTCCRATPFHFAFIPFSFASLSLNYTFFFAFALSRSLHFLGCFSICLPNRPFHTRTTLPSIPSCGCVRFKCFVVLEHGTLVRRRSEKGTLWLQPVERSTGAGCLHLPLLPLSLSLPSPFPLVPFCEPSNSVIHYSLEEF